MPEVMFGSNHLRLRDHKTWASVEVATRQALYRALDIGNVIAFAGAGTSMDYAYPNWKMLAARIIDEMVSNNGVLRQKHNIDLTPIEQKYLSLAKQTIRQSGRQGERRPIETTASRDILGVLNYCHRVYVRRQKEALFDEVVVTSIAKAKAERLSKDKQLFSGLDLTKDGWKNWEPMGLTTTIRSLIDILRIRRFITTNYDDLIEQKLGPRIRQEGRLIGKAPLPSYYDDAITGEDCRIIEGCPSIDRLNSKLSDLVSFAMGAGDFRYGVLHLHGRIERPERRRPETMTLLDGARANLILTEGQYQQQYESNLEAARDRRDVYRLLLAANSLLFVGVSLEDEDSLRPMRQFIADHNVSTSHRPWFALLDSQGFSRDPETAEREKIHMFNHLYYRYGISAIFAERWTGAKQSDIGSIMSALIGELAQGWADYRDSRVRLPIARKPVFSTFSRKHGESSVSHFMIHHANVYPSLLIEKKAVIAKQTIEEAFAAHAQKSTKRDHDSLGPPATMSQQVLEAAHQQAIEANVEDRSIASNHPSVIGRGGTILVLGRQGSGKGTFGYAAASADFGFKGKVITFFGTTLFSNEFLSLVDGASNHMLQGEVRPPHRGETRVRRMFEILLSCRSNVVLVFGGLERLLRPLPYGAIADQLLLDPSKNATELAAIDGAPLPAGLEASRNLRWGRVASPEIEEFFRQAIEFEDTLSKNATSQPYRKLIVLTSSVSPVLPRKAQSLVHTDQLQKAEVSPDWVGSIWGNNGPRGWDRIQHRLAGNSYATETIYRICATFTDVTQRRSDVRRERIKQGRELVERWLRGGRPKLNRPISGFPA